MNRKWALINTFYYMAMVEHINSQFKAKVGILQPIDIALMKKGD